MRNEILAPAGSFEMLFPAVFCGADAVYLGLDSLNARRSAKGFTPKTLCDAVSFCHARGVKVYLTLNTIVYENELDILCENVRSACRAGVDAVIVQDLACAEIVRRIAPDLQLHASTQMSVHSLSGAQILREMGFSRVILSRELSLVEIEHITKHAGLETEVFVHGALCMSISGQCYMSAFLGGRSGNRGSCAGPCRLPFSVSDAGNCHLSLKDMSHINYLPQLAKAGVSSFKIEGRLRSEEYVAAAVNACRRSLNSEKYDVKILQDVFSRSGFTDGYIKGVRDGEMFGVRTAEDTAAAKAAQPKLRELYRREMQKTGIELALEIKADKLKLCVTDGKFTVNESSDFEPKEAKTDSTQALIKAMSKCGGTPFFAIKAEIKGGEGIYIPQSLVNELRRKALAKLLESREKIYPHKTADYILPKFKAVPHIKKGIIMRFESVSQIPQNADKAEKIIVPISEWRQIAPKLRAKTFLELPRAMFGSAEESVKKQIELVENEGFGGFAAENIGHFALLKGKNIIGGFGLNAANPLAAKKYAELGATPLTLSCEITAAQMPFFEGETAAVAYAHMPLMLTRACPLHNVRTCDKCPKSGTLLDRKGVKMPFLCKGSVRTVCNPIALYMGERQNELCVDYSVLYFTIEDAARAQKIIELFLNEQPFDEEFTRGLYYKGTV